MFSLSAPPETLPVPAGKACPTWRALSQGLREGVLLLGHHEVKLLVEDSYTPGEELLNSYSKLFMLQNLNLEAASPLEGKLFCMF